MRTRAALAKAPDNKRAPDQAAPRRSEAVPSPPGRGGNQALQHHLRSGALRPKLAIGSVSDPAEHEADRIAEEAMSGDKTPCACGGDCPKCNGGPATLRRKPAEAGPARAVAGLRSDVFGASAGRPLDAASRAFFEPRFGDLSHVRVHDGPAAARTADSIAARAYTAGDDIGFAAGELNASTQDGRRLLAHELAHVAQGGGVVRRQPKPGGLTVARPPGLAPDQGYNLVPAPPGMFELDDLPDGEIVAADDFLTPRDGYDDFAMAEPDPLDFGPVFGGLEDMGGAAGGVLAANAWHFANFGFKAAGPEAVGLVMFPKLGTSGHPTPFLQSRVAWGHTAVYVRQGGKIRILRSYTPSDLLGVIKEPSLYKPVQEGAKGVDAAVRSGSYAPKRGAPMWTPGARSIEWPVAPGTAEAAARSLPDVGPVAGGKYTGVPSLKGGGCGANCVVWATPHAENALGGPFGPMADGRPTSMADIGSGGRPGGAPMQGSQGRAYSWVKDQGRGSSRIGFDTRTGARVVATIGEDGKVVVNALPHNAIGPPVVGQMTSGMKVLRWGGRAFFVLGVVATTAEIATASEEERERVAVGGVAEFAGGFAAGAVAGLACGPGAPVCSVVLGIGFGFLGGKAARGIAEMIYDQGRHTGGHPATQAELQEFNDLWAKGKECPNCHTAVGERNQWSRFKNFDAKFDVDPSWFDQPAEPAAPREVELTPEEMNQVLAFVEGQSASQGPPAP